jgi:hypothetical protein
MQETQQARRAQDEKDEMSGAVIFIVDENGNKQIKGATPVKLVERLTDGPSYGESFSFSIKKETGIKKKNGEKHRTRLLRKHIFFALQIINSSQCSS